MAKNKRSITVYDGVVFDGEGRVLICQRVNDGLEAVNGKWEVPGGKLEFGETPEQGVVREILEETGYEVEVKKVIPYSDVGVLTYPDRLQYVVVMFFACELADGEHKEVTDHKIGKYKWVKKEELDDYDFMFGNRKVIELAMKMRGQAGGEWESRLWQM